MYLLHKSKWENFLKRSVSRTILPVTTKIKPPKSIHFPEIDNKYIYLLYKERSCSTSRLCFINNLITELIYV